MGYLKLILGEEIRRLSIVPKSLEELIRHINSIKSFRSILVQYIDDENDKITICSEEEYQDFLSSSPKIAKLIISEKGESLPNEKGGNNRSQEILKNIEKSEESKKTNVSESSFLNHPATEIKFLDGIRNLIRNQVNPKFKSSGILVSHKGITCADCKISPIIGVRYKCSECDVNLCEECEFKQNHPHDFFKIRVPEQDNSKGHSASETVDKKFISNVLYLCGMGFDREKALNCLIAFNNDVGLVLQNIENLE